MMLSIDLPQKIVLVGEIDSGKTAILTRIKYNNFSHSKQTNRLSINMASLTVNDQITQHIWEVSLEDKENLKNADAIIICIPANDNKRIEIVNRLIKQLQNSNKTTNVYIFATKMDELKQVEIANIKKIFNNLANENNTKCYFTSAKANNGINDGFENIAKLLTTEKNNEEMLDIYDFYQDDDKPKNKICDVFTKMFSCCYFKSKKSVGFEFVASNIESESNGTAINFNTDYKK